MKTVIVAAVVSVLVTAVFVRYEVKPKLEQKEAELTKLQARLDHLTRRTDYAHEATQVSQLHLQNARDKLYDPRCRPENLKIDLQNGTVGGVSLTASLDEILKELRPCIDKDKEWEARVRTSIAEKKLWIVPIKNTTTEFFFIEMPDGRRHIDIPQRRSYHEIITGGGKTITHYQWRDEELEKILGKAVLRSKNERSSETLTINEGGYSVYKTQFHVRLYEAKYGCVVVRYLSGGTDIIFQKAQEISMWTGKCSALEDKLETNASSGYPLERM